MSRVPIFLFVRDAVVWFYCPDHGLVFFVTPRYEVFRPKCPDCEAAG